MITLTWQHFKTIYMTIERVFANIWMALRGSTIFGRLSFLRTQSGANLDKKTIVSHPPNTNWMLNHPWLPNKIPWHRLAFPWRCWDVEASVDWRVHLLFGHISFCVHLVFANGEAINTRYPIQDLRAIHSLLEKRN